MSDVTFTPPGIPDCFQRLWTPHRMVYIDGENKPSDASAASCPFCVGPEKQDAEALIVARGHHCFAVLNLYPYNPGHLLICPYHHVANYVELDRDQRVEFGEMTATAVRVLQRVSNPDGFNMGMNQGAVAGAGIAAHLHQHVVPRWAGDANFFPIIAKTKAVPQVLGETRDLLADAWVQEG
ncbi:MAG: HIT domain-containing protein [Bowdeniella nasicola]|nr:HIT domain-containing protein [Bowdeniella nasicola]